MGALTGSPSLVQICTVQVPFAAGKSNRPRGSGSPLLRASPSAPPTSRKCTRIFGTPSPFLSSTKPQMYSVEQVFPFGPLESGGPSRGQYAAPQLEGVFVGSGVAVDSGVAIV